MLGRRRQSLIAGAGFLMLLAIALVAALGQSSSSRASQFTKLGNPESHGVASQVDTVGEGPLDGAEAYFSAMRTYPADQIPPNISHAAKLTFNAIAKKGGEGNNHWYA